MKKFLAKMSSPVAILTIFALVMWLTSFPTWISQAFAATALKNISVTLGDSDLNTATTQAYSFQLETAVDADDTFVVTLDPATSAFTILNLEQPDFTNQSGITIASACGGGTDEATLTATTTETFTLTMCTGDSIAADTIITFTLANNKVTNPVGAGSYVIRVQTLDDGSTVRDTADPRVMILDDVVVTADIDTSFTFTVAGVADGQTVNGDTNTTATTTTATTLPFETLASGTPKVLAQDLTVSTNAINGFIVTIQADQVLQSSTGADIDYFQDAEANVTPMAWTVPSNDIDDEDTWGHFGITSEDSDLNGDEFGSALYAGNFATTTRTVFSHSGPADGTTVDKGATRIGFKIEINDLQEAGDDYTNTLTYIATPTF